MKKIINKESLFEDYVKTAFHVFSEVERQFSAHGLTEIITGANEDSFIENPKIFESIKNHMRQTEAWLILSAMYDYANDGILGDQVPIELVFDSEEILSHLDTYRTSHSQVWTDMVTMADARFSLDDGLSQTLDRVALLAHVDIRTVRNAVSAGDLIIKKVDSTSYIDNNSARTWLSSRRGFKPTQIKIKNVEDVTRVSTPAEFGSFLSTQRLKLGMDTDDKKFVAFHPMIDVKALNEIEMGVFKLPLDTVTPLADFYQVDRRDFLVTVMKVFYGDQYRALAETSDTDLLESTNDQ